MLEGSQANKSMFLLNRANGLSTSESDKEAYLLEVLYGSKPFVLYFQYRILVFDHYFYISLLWGGDNDGLFISYFQTVLITFLDDLLVLINHPNSPSG